MYDRLNDLSFVIGAFFTIISIVLFAHMLISGNTAAITVYTAFTFIIFGLLMMFAGKKKK